MTHDELREGANEQLYGGWPMILSGLKTWLEIGRAPHHAGFVALRQLIAGVDAAVTCGDDVTHGRPRRPPS